MAGTSRPCQRCSRGPAKLKDGLSRIMFRLLYTASERVAKRAGFCVVASEEANLARQLRVSGGPDSASGSVSHLNRPKVYCPPRKEGNREVGSKQGFRAIKRRCEFICLAVGRPPSGQNPITGIPHTRTGVDDPHITSTTTGAL